MPAAPKALAGAKLGAKPAAALPPPHQGAECLQTITEIVALKTKQAVVFPAQSDTALMWKAAAVHPMQPLENVHQRAVREAVRALAEAGVDDEAKLKEAESEAMAGYFVMNVGEPARLGPPDPAKLFPEEQVADAKKQLKLIRAAIGESKDDKYAPGFKEKIKKYFDVADAVVRAFPNPDPTKIKVPALEAAAAGLAAQRAAFAKAKTLLEVNAVASGLAKTVFGPLEEALGGVASVQMFHIVDVFYLFRLLVAFRIDSEQEVSADTRRAVSSELTGLLNNGAGREWLKAWLCAKLVDLDQALQALDRNNLMFFVKGGRALKYIENAPEAGKNDWDTSIVINPTLPPKEWYALFAKVHNLVLEKLKAYKRELYVQFHKEGKAFNKTLSDEKLALDNPLDGLAGLFDMEDDPLAGMAGLFDDEVEVKAHSAGCKAELIDIGIPRYDTEEALEQWRTMRAERDYIARWADDGSKPGRAFFANVPHPLHEYYVAEYNIMVREAFAGLSHSLDKTPTRVERLNGVLNLASPALDALFAKYLKTMGDAAVLPNSLSALETIKSKVGKGAYRILVYFLHQCYESYGLHDDKGLAGAFDGFFAANCTADKIPTLVAIPPDFQKGIDKTPTWSAELGQLARAIGFGQWVSGEMAKHLAERQKFILAQPLKDFARDLYAASFLSPREELEVQMALAGAYAARLYAGYQTFPDKRMAELAPVDRLEVNIYASAADAVPAEVMALFKPAIDAQLLKDAYKDKLELQEAGAGQINLVWKQAVAIGAFTYKPLAVKIAVRKGRPLLSYVWGLPLVSLRDLVFEYRHLCAETEEFGARLALRKATAALSEILTLYESPA